MRLLVLGGTRFLGRHLAAQALAAGHELTLVHRGRSGAGLFPEAEHRLADRDGDLAALQGGEWDACIDTCAYLPRQVRAVAAALAGRVGHYQLVSSISVYAGLEALPDDATVAEDQPRAVLAERDTEAVTGASYGGLKALCEDAALQGFGGRCLLTRPGLLVGPHDPTGRFTWWVQRLQRGGPTLAPGAPGAPVQFIDARDAAAWMLRQAAAGTTGAFNLSGPVQPLSLGDLLQGAARALGSDAALHWCDETFLLDAGVAPWTELPLWLPRAASALHRADLARARATGLRTRPLSETVRDTAAWAAGPGAAAGTAAGPPRPAVGLAPAREAELLRRWQAFNAGAG